MPRDPDAPPPAPHRALRHRRAMWRALAACVIASAALGCATVPRAAPELSTQLTGRIQATRLAHVQVVRMYMDERRKEVDRFIEREWIPTFTRELAAQPAVAAAWQSAAESDDPARRAELLAGLTSRVQTRVNAKRLELMQPLDEAERTITRQLDAEYDQMLAMNATLTGLLESGAKATETQQRIAAQLDPKGRLPDYLATADQLVQRLLDTSATPAARQAQIDSLLGALRQPAPIAATTP